MSRGLTHGDGVRIAWGKKSGKISGGAPPDTKGGQPSGEKSEKQADAAGGKGQGADMGKSEEKTDKTKPDGKAKQSGPRPQPKVDPPAPLPIPVPEPVEGYYYPPIPPAQAPNHLPPPPQQPQSQPPCRPLLARLFPCIFAQSIALGQEQERWEYYPPVPPPPKGRQNRAPSPASERSWTHHDSYFPSFEPEVVQHTSFFPKFEAFKSRSQARAEAAAARHAQRTGHLVSVHYPDLPAFAEYGKAKAEWKETQWGVQNWTGFGWARERLPNAQGQTFSAPMPEVSEAMSWRDP
ncbi:hypothetical protein CspHIS471_0103200 [Cutaneotrichosporon sp. HIS471]|nr:hypothetical protein CspHIS471_0103200 [Cutaneotrichosporon sp. HIS471]